MLKIYPQYHSLVDRMVEVGIIATNPEQVCNSIGHICEDSDWWYKKEIQEVRKEYLSIFGCSNKNWRDEIGSVLESITDKQKLFR